MKPDRPPPNAPVRVALDASPIRPRSGGVGCYASGLANSLAIAGVDAVLLSNRAVALEEGAGAPQAAGRGPRIPTLLWLQLAAGRAAAAAGADLFHATTGRAPARCPLPIVTTVHDLTVLSNPDWYPRREAVLSAPWLARSLRRSDALIAVSESTRRAIEAYWAREASGASEAPGASSSAVESPYRDSVIGTRAAAGGRVDATSSAVESPCRDSVIGTRAAAGVGVDASRPPGRPQVFVIPEAADPSFSAPVSAERLDLARRRAGAERYWLFVGDLTVRKNPVALVSGFADAVSRLEAPHPRLVLAGPGGPLTDVVISHAKDRGVASLVSAVGWVDDLPALMAAAECLVCPSLHEGFGLPALEGMAAGTPVIASRRGGLPEVVGDAGILIEPIAAEIAAALVRLGGDRTLRDRLAGAGRVRSAGFTWTRTAQATADVYRSVMARS